MKLKFDVSSQELVLIQQVLQQALPAQCKVWVFGSRAKHQAKYNSDLDLAIECQQALDKTTLMQLETQFDESHLPYSVDVVDMHKAESYFKKIIDQQKVLFPLISNVPELRFLEFSDEWQIKPLGEVTKYTKGFAFKSEDYRDEGVRIVRVSDLGADHIKSGNEKIFLSEAESTGYKKYELEKGNIIITTVGSRPELKESAVGRGIYVNNNDEGLLNQNLLKFENIKGINNKFLFSHINSQKYIDYIMAISRGNANQSNITVKELLQYKVGITEECGEQQKIAAFLGSVDDKLYKLRRRRELLETWKRGLMQKIFSQQLRFLQNDGTAFPDWKDNMISDFMVESRIVGKTGEAARKITVKLWGKGVYAKKEKLMGSANTQYYKRNSGQFIYSKLDFLNCAFGIIPIYLNEYESTVDLPCFDVAKNANKNFVLERIKQKSFYKKYGDMADGSRKAKRIHAEAFLSFPFLLPCLDEQQKIANFLSSVDKKIEAVTNKITKTETFKKGLLQKMFV